MKDPSRRGWRAGGCLDAPLAVCGATPSSRSSDDICLATPPDRVGPAYTAAQQELWIHAGIRVHTGQDQGVERGRNQISCVQRIGENCPRGEPSGSCVGWGGASRHWATPMLLPPTCNEFQQGTKPSCSASRLWLTFNPHGCCGQKCYQLRVVGPSAVEEFARSRDEILWQCLSNILQVDLDQCTEAVQEVATLPLSLGGLGLRSAMRMREFAFWASGADCLPMIRARHPRDRGRVSARVAWRS